MILSGSLVLNKNMRVNYSLVMKKEEKLANLDIKFYGYIIREYSLKN